MTAPDIAIVDYGMANLRSVQKAFAAVGHRACITAEPAAIRSAGRVVLPGVGAFPDAAARLSETGLGDAVRDHIGAGRPFLGVCLGLQLLFDQGHEGATTPGLGVLPGEVIALTPAPGLKIPHMGWNTLDVTRPDCPLLRGLPPDPAVYFVHGYHAVPRDGGLVAATADYGGAICAVAWRDNVVATQFHPEKSQAVGLAMLANFAGM